ncbi:MAG: DUF2809 domain-containing protein [Candidatus Pristimantibacillus sp.]
MTRILYLIAVFIAIFLGMCSRAFSNELPVFVAQHFGDALWASMIYFGVRCLWTDRTKSWAVGFSIIVCFVIEFSQLYQADWINEIRSTLIGSLVLGRGFLAVDLVRYSVGIIVSCLVDRLIIDRIRIRK